MKYRIILSLALLTILAFAAVVSADHGATHDSAVAPGAAPAVAPTNFNL